MNRDEPQLRRSNNAWLWYVSKMSAIVWSLFIVTIHVIEILMRNIGGGLSPIDVESIIAYYEMGAVLLLTSFAFIVLRLSGVPWWMTFVILLIQFWSEWLVDLNMTISSMDSVGLLYAFLLSCDFSLLEAVDMVVHKTTSPSCSVGSMLFDSIVQIE